MTKKKQIKVRWSGPSGKIRQSSNKQLLALLKNRQLCKAFGKDRMYKLEIDVTKILRFLRRIFRDYNLMSAYHDFSHNYVTAITVIRAFIGGLKLKKKFSFQNLQILSVAALFHDSGYLRKSKFSKREDLRSHSRRSAYFTKEFLSTVKLKEINVQDVLTLQSYTSYSSRGLRKKLEGNTLAQILVGADLMQVVDTNYPQNLEILREYVGTTKDSLDKKSQENFVKFAKESTRGIWKYLDAFYGKRERNPYRKGWERFSNFMREKYGVEVNKI